MAETFSLLIAADDEQRLWSALSFAAAQAALGANVRIFFSGAAARVCASAVDFASDPLHQAKGIPTITEVITSCRELGVDFSVCQTGMALCDLEAAHIAPYCQITGLVAWLAAERKGQLIFV